MSYQQSPDDRTGVPAGPPPGWYPDPGGLQALRWWDGGQWSPHTQPLPGTPQPQPAYPDAAAADGEGYGWFGQESTGRHRQESGPADGAAYSPGPASGSYPASFPPAEPQQPDPYQPQDPQGPYQPQGWPPQQPYAPGPQSQTHRAPRQPGKRKVRRALVGLGALIGVIIAISVATAHNSPSAGNTAATSTAPASSPARVSSAPSPASCASQIAAWESGGGVSDLETVGSDMSALGNADTALYGALSAGADASQQEAGLQTAAASVQADSQTADANLPPSCILGLRSNLRAGLTDCNKAAISSAQAVSEMSSGNYDVATADILAADKDENAGNTKIVAAAADIKAYENG